MTDDSLTPRENAALTALERAYDRGVRDHEYRSAGASRPGPREAHVVTGTVMRQAHNVEDATVPSDQELLYMVTGDLGAILSHMSTDRPRQADLEGVRRRARQGLERVETVIERNKS